MKFCTFIASAPVTVCYQWSIRIPQQSSGGTCLTTQSVLSCCSNIAQFNRISHLARDMTRQFSEKTRQLVDLGSTISHISHRHRYLDIWCVSNLMIIYCGHKKYINGQSCWHEYFCTRPPAKPLVSNVSHWSSCFDDLFSGYHTHVCWTCDFCVSLNR